MESYCAKIEDGVVAKVLVCDSAEWCVRNLGGDWFCTGERLVGVGWPVVDGVIVEPEPPVPMPQDGQMYQWDEDEQQWA